MTIPELLVAAKLILAVAVTIAAKKRTVTIARE